jgi:hypothetical protein
MGIDGKAFCAAIGDWLKSHDQSRGNEVSSPPDAA